MPSDMSILHANSPLADSNYNRRPGHLVPIPVKTFIIRRTVFVKHDRYELTTRLYQLDLGGLIQETR